MYLLCTYNVWGLPYGKAVITNLCRSSKTFISDGDTTDNSYSVLQECNCVRGQLDVYIAIRVTPPRPHPQCVHFLHTSTHWYTPFPSASLHYSMTPATRSLFVRSPTGPGHSLFRRVACQLDTKLHWHVARTDPPYLRPHTIVLRPHHKSASSPTDRKSPSHYDQFRQLLRLCRLSSGRSCATNKWRRSEVCFALTCL